MNLKVNGCHDIGLIDNYAVSWVIPTLLYGFFTHHDSIV